jgi:hypothetical protein
MNNNLLAIVKQIIAEQGEGILGDPPRLRSFVKDYAKDEPQEERAAFGRCIEIGAYREFGKTNSQNDRNMLKAKLLLQLTKEGVDRKLGVDTLNMLEAALFGRAPRAAPRQTPAPALPPRRNAERGAAGIETPAGAMGAGRFTLKTLIFAAAGGAGAFAGEEVSGRLRMNMTFSYALGTHVLEMAFWAGILSLLISIALITAQHVLQRKPPNLKRVLPPMLLGIVTGTFAGGIAQVIFNYTQNISPFVRTTSNALCWGVFGAGLGLGVSFFMPNFPKKRAALAGFLGGTLGGAIYVAMISSEQNIGGLIGVVVLGTAIGAVISFVEEALREAWLTVVWGPKETTNISLGQKPVVFGASREADVYLSPRRGEPEIPPVRAVVGIDGGRVFLDDRVSGGRRELRNGETVDLGRVSVIANVKTGH